MRTDFVGEFLTPTKKRVVFLVFEIQSLQLGEQN